MLFLGRFLKTGEIIQIMQIMHTGEIIQIMQIMQTARLRGEKKAEERA